VNSRNKGKVGEREFASLLRENGYDARRGQQFSGSPDSPDVVSDALAWLHVEVKRVQNLNLTDACVQAEGDCGRGVPAGHKKPWVVAHRRNHAPWLITMRAEFFFELLREFQPVAAPLANGTNGTEATDKCTAREDARPTLPRTSQRDVPTTTIFRRDAEKHPPEAGATNNQETKD
jgi:hypothetical protein